jgi:hypothetical protein
LFKKDDTDTTDLEKNNGRSCNKTKHHTMHFDFYKSVQLLERTPNVLDAFLQGLSKEWTLNHEGDDTWSAFDVVGHLIYCDKHNWLMRVKHLMKEGTAAVFPSFDRYAHAALYKAVPSDKLLQTFQMTRKEVLQEIQWMQLQEADFLKKGLHPTFGEVNLSQLFSAWVVHDLSHLSQISRVMAKHYGADVGPWVSFLRILQ